MTKIIKEMLPPDVQAARDAQDLLIECCFVAEKRREQLCRSMSQGFREAYLLDSNLFGAPVPQLNKVACTLNGIGRFRPLSSVRQHVCYEFVAFVKLKDTVRSGKWVAGAEMTEEEALAEQQRMFAEASVRMNGTAPAPKQQSEPEPNLDS